MWTGSLGVPTSNDIPYVHRATGGKLPHAFEFFLVNWISPIHPMNVLDTNGSPIVRKGDGVEGRGGQRKRKPAAERQTEIIRCWIEHILKPKGCPLLTGLRRTREFETLIALGRLDSVYR